MKGSRLHKFKVGGEVCGLCETSDGNIAVCVRDYGNTHRLEMYNKHGKHLRTINLPEQCDSWSVTRHRDNIIVADEDNKSLHVCNMYKLVTSIQLQFEPSYISSCDQAVWVCSDYQLHRVNIDGDYKVLGIDKVPLQDHHGHVSGIAVSSNRLVLCYWNSHKLHMYDHGGQLLFVYGGQHGQGDNELNHPQDVCIDDNNYTYIPDTCNCSVVVVNPHNKPVGNIHVGRQTHSLTVSNNRLYVGYYYTVETYSLTWS